MVDIKRRVCDRCGFGIHPGNFRFITTCNYHGEPVGKLDGAVLDLTRVNEQDCAYFWCCVCHESKRNTLRGHPRCLRLERDMVICASGSSCRHIQKGCRWCMKYNRYGEAVVRGDGSVVAHGVAGRHARAMRERRESGIGWPYSPTWLEDDTVYETGSRRC